MIHFEKIDEKKGTNLILLADESFSNIDLFRVGDKQE